MNIFCMSHTFLQSLGRRKPTKQDTTTNVVSFETAKKTREINREDERILSEIRRKQKEMLYYGIGGEPSPDMSVSEYASYLCSDITDSNQSYFNSRWGDFLERHPEIQIADLIQEVQ